MKMLSAIIVCLGFTLTYGNPCADLTGFWRNELGSNVTIIHIGDSSKITGQYNTSVESSAGAARISSPLTGIVKEVDDGSLVAFNVLWNRGASLTSWVGQCIVCDDEPKIFTTWTLRSLKTPKGKWMTTMVNQDTFWRLDIPDQEISLPFEPPTEANPITTDITGEWRSISGDAFTITSAPLRGRLEGQHLTPEDGVSSISFPSEVPLFGSVDGNNTHIALGFAAAGPLKIKGWTGHIYNPKANGKIIETSWLAHAFMESCTDPRRFVNYGMDNYTRPVPGA